MINLDDTKALTRIAEALERIAEAEARGAELSEKVVQRTGAEPAGIPIMLIVEVLIALIGILVRHVVADPVPAVKLRELRKKLMPYQPVRPARKEEEGAIPIDGTVWDGDEELERHDRMFNGKEAE